MVSRKPRDPVDKQLADIARQGGWLAGAAHACAFLLILLFSAGSLVALSGDALVRVVTLGRQPATIPPAISIAVSTLLVVAMDAGMLYAASMLRRLAERRAPAEERRVHLGVLICACVLEASTYAYMAARYDPPADWQGWALVAGRALAAPLFSVYLSLAHPIPVGPRDILYQVELASGKGVIRDAVTVANDHTAPLARKMALYGASAVMQPADRARLDGMIAVMQDDHLAAPSNMMPDALSELSAPLTANTGTDGQVASTYATSVATARQDGRTLTLLQRAGPKRAVPARVKARQTRQARRVRTGDAPNAPYEAEARAAWAQGHRTIGRMERHTSMGHAAAQGWVRMLKAEERAATQAEAQEA